MCSGGFASSLYRSSFGPTTGESICDFFFISLKADLCVFWNQVVCVIIDGSTLLSFLGWELGSDLPCLPTEWLINSPVLAEEILSREAVEKHLLLCLKLLLVVLVTINLWGDLSCYCMNRRYKLLKIQRHEKMEKPPTKKHILFQMFLVPYYSLWSLRC